MFAFSYLKLRVFIIYKQISDSSYQDGLVTVPELYWLSFGFDSENGR